MKEPSVSVIIPVYNVEAYLDDCLDSIVNQTFPNLDILLVVGKSTDNSTELCKKWCHRDSRVRMVLENQRGLGPARNQGIAEAKGEYIVFVDSDDKIKPTFVEKMYEAIIGGQADLAECDYNRIREYSDKMEYVSCTGIMGKEFDISDKLLIGNISMWKIMTKKELWEKNKILQPNGVAEDFFTYPLLLFSAIKIVNVSESLYLYRKDNAGNLSSTYKVTYPQIIPVMDNLIRECIKRDYFNKYVRELSAYIRKWISRYCSISLGLLDYNEYVEMRRGYIDVYNRYFDDLLYGEEAMLGGFNLTRIISKLPLIEDPYFRFNFTSLISIMSKKTTKFTVRHKNRYRQFMLKREYGGFFFELLNRKRPQFFFFDLLEERHDIYQKNGMFFTKSDAFDEMEIGQSDIDKVIYRDSFECQKLWEKSCVNFFEELFRIINPSKVFMIKSFLSERYSDGAQTFYYDELEQIQKTNNLLKQYYSFIEKRFPDIRSIEVSLPDNYNCTDINYEFGCFPWHLNEWANIQIAESVSKEIEK